MGTRFRVLAAPVDSSTGDRRRFAPDAITHQALPMPLRWVRQDVGAHDGAVTVAAIQDVEVDGANIWISGVFFDDVAPETMPRLAEDVAEAMKLCREGVLGPSVDLDDFEAAPVRIGEDEVLDYEDITEEDELELLVTKGRMRSATLVAIPAFAETNHTMTFDDAEEEEEEEDGQADEETDAGEDDEAVSEPENEADEDTPELAALIASLSAAETLFSFDAFSAVRPDKLLPITYDFERGIVYGHVAPWGQCHQGIPDACVLAPRDEDGGKYRDFHVHRVETDQGIVYAGRITAGGQHPDVTENVTAHHVRQAHDSMTTVAYVRATEDAFGIFVCGPIVPGLDEQTRGVLSRRKVSGDWRETQDGLSMIEVLALGPGPRALSEPGFPIRLGFAGTRQVALVASLSPEAYPEMSIGSFDFTEAFRQAYNVIQEEEAAKLEAEQLRGELGELLNADAEQARDELARTIGA